jgi:glycerol-3-phosphate dehydrogenase
MAKIAVDRVVERDGRQAPCRTHEIPLGEPIKPDRLPRVEGVPEESYEALAGRYGHLAERVLRSAASRGEFSQPILAGLPDLLAEVPYAAANEQARTVGDVLLRRTRLGLLAGRELTTGADETPRRVARAMATELGWDERRIQAEVDRFRDEAESEGIGLGDLGG